MMLDTASGKFHIGQLTLGASLKESDFLASEFGTSAKGVRHSELNYYEIWKQVSPQLEIGLTLGFVPNGRLQRISAQLIKPGIRGSEWSKAKEDGIKQFHDKWLKEQLGEPPYQYAWGRVMSIIEPHWYSANITIDYRRGRQPVSI